MDFETHRHARTLASSRALVALAASVFAASSGAERVSAQVRATDGSQRAVLVTGATSGIGRATAELLAERGFYVYAGARSDDDMAELNGIENIEAVRLDVTVPDEIEAAVESVRQAGRGLYGLINNAGVAVVGPLVELRDEDLAFQLDVNLWGPYRVTKAFAPLVIESGGRIATTSSISGFVTWAFGGPYTMSKHGVEAFTDALAAELAPHGVAVAAIQPGNFRSEIWFTLTERLRDAGYGGEGSLYEGQLDRMLESPADRSQYEEPTAVAEAFFDFLTEEEPRRRYMVVPNQREAELTLRAVLRRLVELNGDHAYSYDRDVLVRMLDEALERGMGR